MCICICVEQSGLSSLKNLKKSEENLKQVKEWYFIPQKRLQKIFQSLRNGMPIIIFRTF